MNPSEPKPIKLGMPNTPIKPEQVKGSDGVYLTFKEDSVEKDQDPRMQTVAYVVAVVVAVCVVAILAAGTVKLIVWMF